MKLEENGLFCLKAHVLFFWHIVCSDIHTMKYSGDREILWKLPKMQVVAGNFIFRNADREIIKQLNISYMIYLSDTLQEAVLYSKYRLAKGRC